MTWRTIRLRHEIGIDEGTNVNDDLYDLGTKTRLEVLGDAELGSRLPATDEFTKDFEHEMTRREWGEVWSRPGLDRRTRITITLAMLVMQGLDDELAIYVRAAIRNGVTIDEIFEIIHQAGLYAGTPMAHRAFAVARAAVVDLPSAEAE